MSGFARASVFALLAALFIGLVSGCDRGRPPGPPIPLKATRVTDLARLMTRAEVDGLERRLACYEARSSHTIAMLTIPGLEGVSIESFGLAVAKDWALGRPGVDDGILVLVARDERRVRIELGTGFARVIDDALAARIVEEALVPGLREGKIAAALDAGLTRLMREASRLDTAPKGGAGRCVAFRRAACPTNARHDRLLTCLPT